MLTDVERLQAIEPLRRANRWEDLARLGEGLAVVADRARLEVLDAVAFAFLRLKLVVEPGGAVCLAALLSGRFDARGKVVGCVISGGNIDPAVFSRALARLAA